MKKKKTKITKLRADIFPITKLSKKEYLIKDHINLSGENPLIGPQFVSLTNVYTAKKGIVVAGLKKGVHPNKHERKILLKAGIAAFCYNLVPKVIKAASKGFKVQAIGKTKSVTKNNMTK